MTTTDLHSKLRLIQHEIELAEESRDSLSDLYELKKAYMEAIADKESEQRVQVPIPAVTFSGGALRRSSRFRWTTRRTTA